MTKLVLNFNFEIGSASGFSINKQGARNLRIQHTKYLARSKNKIAFSMKQFTKTSKPGKQLPSELPVGYFVP